MLRFALSSILALALLTGSVARVAGQNLPPIRIVYPSVCTGDDGRFLDYFGDTHRLELRSLAEVSPWVVDALLATEDRDFYSHGGVSIKSLGRALWGTLTGHLQGGSTITMQLARNLFLSNERTLSRKLAEIDLAGELERAYSKDEILRLYLNVVYFGHGCYGIRAAAEEYYSEPPEHLDIVESATLVGLVQAPSAYDPLRHPERAIARRNEVLHNLVEVGRIREEEFAKLRRVPLDLHPRQHLGAWFVGYVRHRAADILRAQGQSLDTGRFTVVTTLRETVERAAEDAVRAQWDELPKPMKSAQVGLVVLDVATGAVRAMIGGNPGTDAHGLNRATRIRRQAGSTFKTFLYGSLLEDGYTLGTPIPDAPIVVDSGTAYEWRPSNDDGVASGISIPLFDAMRHSVNLAAAHAVTQYTTPARMAAFARRCGITSQLPEFPSLALGAAEVSPLEMAAAMRTVAAMGVRATPWAIRRIEDRNGRVVWSSTPDTSRVIDSSTAALLTSALAAVVDSGTASSVRNRYSGPAAGKTGTTQRNVDAWFVGFTPALCAAVWVGFDDASRSLVGAHSYGGRVCAPIWARMMRHVGMPNDVSSTVFPIPEDVRTIPLCTETGLPATNACPHVREYLVSARSLVVPCFLHPGDLRDR